MATSNALPAESIDTDEGTEEVSLHDEIEAAFEAESADPTDEVREQRAAPQAEEKPQTEGARQRDEYGRFARTAAEGPAGPAKAPTQPQGAVPQDIKPPASWTPQAREEWATLSPRVKQEVARREWEAARVVQDAAAGRQFQQAFERVVSPYEMFIRSEGGNPLQAVQNMMQTAAELRIGTPEAKANLIAGLVKTFGIDVQLLDGALDTVINGTPAKPGQPQQQQFRDPRVDQMIAQQNWQAQQQAEIQSGQMREFLTQFGGTHEFYRDVAATMADIVELKSKRGEYIDVEKIYEQACKLDPDVSTILAQRAAGSQRQHSSSAAVLRAKRAASSVKGEAAPDGAYVPKDDSIRAALEAAIENTGRV